MALKPYGSQMIVTRAFMVVSCVVR